MYKTNYQNTIKTTINLFYTKVPNLIIMPAAAEDRETSLWVLRSLDRASEQNSLLGPSDFSAFWPANPSTGQLRCSGVLSFADGRIFQSKKKKKMRQYNSIKLNFYYTRQDDVLEIEIDALEVRTRML